MSFFAGLILFGMLVDASPSDGLGQVATIQSETPQRETLSNSNSANPSSVAPADSANPLNSGDPATTAIPGAGRNDAAKSEKPLAVNPVPAIIKLEQNTLHIPFLLQPPKIEEFETMKPSRSDMVRVSTFTQQFPHDGAQPSQQTQVYMGYDHQNLYVVWICFDNEPEKIRAHLSRRENIFDDDYVEIILDPFHDQRRGLVFSTNPHGIQADGL